MIRALTAVIFLALVAPSAAVPDCPDAKPQRSVLSGQGVLESVIGGPDGKLYYTDTSKDALMRLDAPGKQPAVLADGIDSPGGLLVGLDGKSIIVGYGDGFQQGATGNIQGTAGLIQVDLATGKKKTIVTGTSMSNGLARDPAGAIYASDDAGTGIDRIVGDKVQQRWASVISSNGLAVSANGRYLFANQTFQPAAIQRVDMTDPTIVEKYAAPGPEDIHAGLDGLTIDQNDRLFAATNGVSGQVWRVGTDRSICALSKAVPLASAVGFGGGGAFPLTSLYAVGFAGELVELPDARPAPPAVPARVAYLRVRVRPRFVRAKKRSRVTVIVRRVMTPEPRAFVRVGRKAARTNARGRVRVKVRPRHRGFLPVRVRAIGVKPVKMRVRVLRAKPAPRPQALTG